jgi:hypothetical protein
MHFFFKNKYSLLLTLLLAFSLNVKSYSQPVAALLKPAVKNGGFKIDGYYLWCSSVMKRRTIFISLLTVRQACVSWLNTKF